MSWLLTFSGCVIPSFAFIVVFLGDFLISLVMFCEGKLYIIATKIPDEKKNYFYFLIDKNILLTTKN